MRAAVALGELATRPELQNDRFHLVTMAWAAIVALLQTQAPHARQAAYQAFATLPEKEQHDLLAYLRCERIQDAELSPASAEITYFIRLRPADHEASPSWVLRRVVTESGTVDELLGRDGQWRPSDMLARAERGELPGRLEQTSDALPRRVLATAVWQFGAIRRALALQESGGFVLRLAKETPGTAFEEFDVEDREEVIAFLTRAPLVMTGAEGTYRTDGMWVWSESIVDMVRETGSHPENKFYGHMLAREFALPETVAPDVVERARRLVGSAGAQGADRIQERNVPGQPPPPTPAERRRALSAWHAEWVEKHAATTPFRPENHPEGSDYNLHHVDMDASPEADREYVRRAREIMGQDPETGFDIGF
ncbi:hypothetical protein [Actinoplanes sp. NBRC 101535]|uniref:hypothetical protein n=2 Tax=Actinoplanes TaxID=1865 RepID=UPI0025573AF5|nr:hypothetical protein [Actinoplanes sp. NBRC 101535]